MSLVLALHLAFLLKKMTDSIALYFELNLSIWISLTEKLNEPAELILQFRILLQK